MNCIVTSNKSLKACCERTEKRRRNFRSENNRRLHEKRTSCKAWRNVNRNNRSRNKRSSSKHDELKIWSNNWRFHFVDRWRNSCKAWSEMIERMNWFQRVCWQAIIDRTSSCVVFISWPILNDTFEPCIFDSMIHALNMLSGVCLIHLVDERQISDQFINIYFQIVVHGTKKRQKLFDLTTCMNNNCDVNIYILDRNRKADSVNDWLIVLTCNRNASDRRKSSRTNRVKKMTADR